MDIWRTGIVRQPMADVIARGRLEGPVAWLQESDGYRFLADPFGVERDGRHHVFVEAYDYRTRIGGIDVFSFDDELASIVRAPALREPWHLSYPVTIESEGETYMLPEAHRSGRLTLYRAVDFPGRWEAETVIDLPEVPVDATPLFHDGLWWLFYSPATDKAAKVSRLHVAFADRLTGPWRAHPGNPVRVDASGSRPGGTPLIVGDTVVLPVQDCSRTYGGGIRPLHIHNLSPTMFEAESGRLIAPPPEARGFDEGLHTLSACGPWTLFDVKRIDRSLAGKAVDARGRVRRAFRGCFPPPR